MNGWLKILLTAAALVVIVIGSVIGILLGRELWQHVAADIVVSDVINVDPANETIVEQFYLSSFERVGGGPLLRATLYVSQEFEVEGDISSRSKSTRSNTLNMLFLEPGAPERWLFETNDQLIHQTTSLSILPIGAKQEDQPEIALLLQLIKADTNGDKRLSEKDTTSVALVHPDGSGLVTLIEDQQSTINALPDPSTIVLSVETKTGVEIIRIEPTSFAILDRRAIDFPK